MIRTRTTLVVALAAAAVLGGTGVSQAGTPVGPVPHDNHGAVHAGDKHAAARPVGGRAASFDKVTRTVEQHGKVRVTITLADAPTKAPDALVRADLRREADHGRTAALRALGGPAGTKSIPGAPAMTALVDAHDVTALRDEPAVRSISRSTELTPQGTSAFGAAAGVQLPKWWHRPKMGLNWTYANGYNGSGQKVVIVDTGVDYTHPWLSGRVVDGACFSQTGCGNGQTYAYGVAAGKNCTYSYTCAHGTHVAHIAAGANGVARSARIVAINASSRNAKGEPTFYDADLINALWYAYYYVSPAPAAVNISVGSDSVYSQVCDSANQSLADWITALRSRGTATVVAAGNGNSATGVSKPACMSSAIVVGNATLTSATGVPAVLGGVYGGSNSSSLVDLWAPGTDICSAVPTNLDNDGSADGVDCTYYGTSMAAPQVTGSFAVLKAARPSYTVNQELSAFVRNGFAITDARNGIRRSMVDVASAVYYG
jgi:subtilisin